MKRQAVVFFFMTFKPMVFVKDAFITRICMRFV